MTGASSAPAAPAGHANDTAHVPVDPGGWPPRGVVARALVVALRAISSLPPRARRHIGGAIGMAAFALDARRRAATIDTMAVVARATGRAGGPRLALDAWRRYGEMLADAIPIVACPGGPMDWVVGEAAGWENLAAALAGGRGAVLVGLHQGNWEVGATVIAQRHRLAAVVDPVGPSGIDAVVQASRRARGIATIAVGRASRGSLAALRRGEAVAILVDRPVAPGHGAATVAFLGVPTTFPIGAVRLARRAGAPIVPLSGWRRDDGRMAFAAGAPLHVGDLETDADALARVVAGLEGPVRDLPSGWFMFRRAWPEAASAGNATAVRASAIDVHAQLAAGAIRVGAAVAGRVPDGTARAAARAIGRGLARMPTERIAKMSLNVAAVTGLDAGDPRVRSAVARAAILQAENYADLYRTPFIGRAEAARRIELDGDGWPHLRDDLAKGGAVLVSAHLGRLELLGHALLGERARVVLVVERLRSRAVHDVVTRLRSRPGLEVVTANDGLLPVARALDGGALVVVLVDLMPRVAGTRPPSIATRMGRGTITMPASPFRLAARRRVPLFLGYGLALPGGRVRATVEARLAGTVDAEVAWGDDPGPAAIAAAVAVGRRLGDVIARDPGQWTLGHEVARPAAHA